MLLPKDSPLRWNVDWTPLAIGLGMAQQVYSPYFTPWAANPIGPLIEQIIPDFARLTRRDSSALKVFVCATNVNRTALRIFGPGEITAKAVMASTCLPTLYQAVEIDAVFYWDGGYMGNPALNPLVDCADDLLTILIDPLDVVDGPPITAREIVNRINEVSFGASWGHGDAPNRIDQPVTRQRASYGRKVQEKAVPSCPERPIHGENRHGVKTKPLARFHLRTARAWTQGGTAMD
jgi:predicted acylesterase/phospholipase RssA